MKKLIPLLLLLFIGKISFSQKEDKQASKTVKTVGIFDMREAKSGYAINDYYVQLEPSQIKEFNGKKVKVTGKLLVVKAIDPNEKVRTQGSLKDRKFILNPQIRIIK